VHGHCWQRIGSAHHRSGRIKYAALVMLAAITLLAGPLFAQSRSGTPSAEDNAKEWSFSFEISGYIVPHDTSYASPIFSADRQWLHLEARYNDENQQTASLWAGYNLRTGSKLVLEATPMLGAVFGRTNGIAPGCEFSLAYKRIELSSEMEYVIDTGNHTNSFLYSWNELVYSATDWLHVGLLSQRTRAYHTSLDVQRGFSVGLSHGKVDFTTYVFNAGWTTPTLVFALGFNF
jgi:hypothetical protein